MKIKKIIATVSTLAIASSMFAGFTVAKAACPVDMTFTYNAEKSSKNVAVLDVVVTGLETFSSYNFTLSGFPTDNACTLTYKWGDSISGMANPTSTKVSKGNAIMNGTSEGGYDVSIDPNGTLLATITYTFANDIAEDFVATMHGNAAVGGKVDANQTSNVTYICKQTNADLKLEAKTVTIKADPTPAPAEETVTAENLADGVANDYEIDGKIYKYTPFKATVDFASKTIDGAKIEIDGVEKTVEKIKFSNIPTEITGSATVGIIVKSLASQNVGAVKLIVK